MTNSPTIEAQIKGFELASSIYPIYELLESIKGTSFRSCRFSMIQGNNRVIKRSPCKDPVLVLIV